MGLGLWILIAAIESPDPPLKDTSLGAFLAVRTSFVFPHV
jgi:hypothetical protein